MRSPTMIPAAGERLVRFVGDRVRFTIASSAQAGDGWRAVLRTNLGRGQQVRDEVVTAIGAGQPFAGASWRDIPMNRGPDGWTLELSLPETGFFRAKPYLVDAKGWQRWPDGHDVGLCVQPNSLRTANTIYCAFARAFGVTKGMASTRIPALDEQMAAFDRHGFTLIPPSGTLRDLTAQLPHIFDTLDCRILHLLPINPTPTTYARMGRYGSPYAALDFTAIDPALVVFDQRTTAVEQFRELAYGVHLRGGRLYLDLAINHTGWGSWLQNEHPEWFRRNADGTFHSPGAWGNTWADLVELDHRFPALWEHLAEAFLEWCRRGVDGFRCDAGYMLPTPAWQYITARVRQEFPSTCFLLEGLGGGWDDTERLLTDGGMQWAYSELFQNYGGSEVASYLDHAHRQSTRVGTLVHYSETHDNARLAQGGKAWSLLRNRLCALTSTSAAFGFTCGVEWLAAEKVEVHQSRSLNWGATDNLVDALATLNRLISDHPCFFDGARLTRLSTVASPVYALRRDSAEGTDTLLVLANLDAVAKQELHLDTAAWDACGQPVIDLLDGGTVKPVQRAGAMVLTLAPGQVLCLATATTPRGLGGTLYRRLRSQAAQALQVLAQALPLEDIGPHDWRELAKIFAADPLRFAGSVHRLDRALARQDLIAALTAGEAANDLPRALEWTLADRQRVVPVPNGHWIVVRDDSPFSASLSGIAGQAPRHVRAVRADHGFVACLPTTAPAHGGEATLTLERFTAEGHQVHGRLRLLGDGYDLSQADRTTGLALLTNGRGAMARMHADLGAIASKYDCVLGANLHHEVPCDRHVFIKRVRVWINADGFITACDRHNLEHFTAGPPACWRFIANAGDGRVVPIDLCVDLLDGRNAVALRFTRSAAPPPRGVALPDTLQVRLTVRLDLEDRSFHSQTVRDEHLAAHFPACVGPLEQRHGFRFSPAGDRSLEAWCDQGSWHADAEWSIAVGHPIDAERGQSPSGDAWSPGWFELPLAAGASATLVASADGEIPGAEVANVFTTRHNQQQIIVQRAGIGHDAFAATLARAANAFVVRRGKLKTVIAGYPWFLDWGRDSLISARGLLAAGLVDEVQDLLVAFARLERVGTLPNALHGEDHANRDTSDAPLWLGMACADLAAIRGDAVYALKVDDRRTIADVLAAIAHGYLRGTPNGIKVDAASGLVFSPPHFTWMDTNHPACTPREGYPVEIQALWIRLLRQLEAARIPTAGEPWWAVADRAQASLSRRYWLEDEGWLADNLIAPAGVPADHAVRDHSLRSNGLIAVCCGLLDKNKARRLVLATQRHLVVPGALRSLAPLPVKPALIVLGGDGRPLFDPNHPFQGQYAGDEDTRRKPAYHNGTAWTWTFPAFCEAMALAWDHAPDAVAAARAYLSSADRLLASGCLGQLPEIVDGDAPHTQRGCDAQAWSACEALRVWKMLKKT